MMALRVALLGTGGIAGGHAVAIRALPGKAELVAVCDLDRVKGEEFKKQWAVPEYFDDLDLMIGRVKPDVVHVLLPPAAHAEASIACLNRGCHVFAEKPFCVTSEESRAVLRAAEASGRRVGVNHNLTYMPPVLRLIDLIREQRLGQVQNVTMMYNLPMPALDAGMHSHWMFRKPGNIMLELGVHPLSVIHRLLGPVTGSATAVSDERILNHGGTFYGTWQSSLVCERGTAQFVLSMGDRYMSTFVHVIGQDGEAVADIRRNTLHSLECTHYKRTRDLVDSRRTARDLIKQSRGNLIAALKGAVGLGPAYDLQISSMTASAAAFYSALSEGRPLPVDGTDGLAVVSACETIIESAHDFAAKGTARATK